MKRAGRTPIATCAALAAGILTGCETFRGGGEDAGGTATGSRTGTIPRLVPNVVVARTGSGSGTVTSDPAGIACGTMCEFTFPAGITVTLTAAPDARSAFAGWKGAGCAGTGACRFVVGARVTISAAFVRRAIPQRVAPSASPR